MLARSHEPEANNKALDNNLDRIGIWGEWKTGVPGEKPLGARKRTNKKLNPQMTPGRESKTGHIGGRRALSPLRHCVRQNRCELMIKTFFWVYSLKFEDFVFFKMYDESEHFENKFCYPGELSGAEILASCQLTTKSAERKSTLITNKGVHNFLRSQHRENRWSRKKHFQMNCPILNLWNKQIDSWCETSFSGKHEK